MVIHRSFLELIINTHYDYLMTTEWLLNGNGILIELTMKNNRPATI